VGLMEDAERKELREQLLNCFGLIRYAIGKHKIRRIINDVFDGKYEELIDDEEE
jgi:hypothetical protein